MKQAVKWEHWHCPCIIIICVATDMLMVFCCCAIWHYLLLVSQKNTAGLFISLLDSHPIVIMIIIYIFSVNILDKGFNMQCSFFRWMCHALNSLRSHVSSLVASQVSKKVKKKIQFFGCCACAVMSLLLLLCVIKYTFIHTYYSSSAFFSLLPNKRHAIKNGPIFIGIDELERRRSRA